MTKEVPSQVSVDPADRYHIAVALTCFNRRSKTLQCLDRLMQSAEGSGVRLSVYLVDDGSTDGTGDAVRAAFPGVQVMPGSGQLYWNGGMRLAMGEAIGAGADAVLWLNDDTLLKPDALQRMVDVWQRRKSETGRDAVVVASTCDPATGAITYGGCARDSRWRPLRFRLVQPDDVRVLTCDAMNGNCVLLPAGVVAKVGNLEPGFLHSMGDLDYGLRCRMVGVELLVAPGFIGTCANDTAERVRRSRANSLRTYWQDVTGFRKSPPRAWWLFCTRHGGFLGPLIFLKPYVGAVLRGLASGRL